MRTLDGFILVHMATACLGLRKPSVVSTVCTYLVVSSWRTHNNPQGPLWKSRFGNRVRLLLKGCTSGSTRFSTWGSIPGSLSEIHYWNIWWLSHFLCYLRLQFLWGFHSKPVVARGCQLDNPRSLDLLIVTSTQFTGFSSVKVELRTPHLKLGSISCNSISFIKA